MISKTGGIFGEGFIRPVLTWIFYTSILSGTLPAETIQGRVIDRNSRNPLPRVSVFLEENGFNTETDERGRFTFSDLPRGQYTLRFSMEGYQTLEGITILVSDKGDFYVEAELLPLPPKPREEVVVYAPAGTETTAALFKPRLFQSDDVIGLPGGAEDLNRTLIAKAAAARSSEFSNDLIVRGGSPWENGFYIDGIPFLDLNHFQRQGSSAGLISIVDASLIEEMLFFTGGFPAAYGDRMSSVVDIRLREGRRDRISTRLGLNTAGGSGCMEGPIFKRRGAWLLSLRRNYHDVLAGIIGYGIAPRFGDIHFKITLDIDSRNKLTFLDIFGDSRLSYDLETAVENGFNSFLDLDSRQNTAGLNWISVLGQGNTLETSLSFSTFGLCHTITHVTQDREYSIFNDRFARLSLRCVNLISLSGNTHLQWGGEVNREKLRFDDYLKNYLNRWETPVPGINRTGRMEKTTAGLFLTATTTFRRRLEVSIGLRLDNSSSAKKTRLSPRLTSNLRITPRWSLTGALGIYNQAVPLFLEIENGTEKKERIPSSIHAVLGLRFELEEKADFQLDFFHKRYRDLPLSPEEPTLYVMDGYLNFSRFVPSNPLVDSGAAVSRGLEILLRKRGEAKLRGTFSLSLSRHIYRDYQGIWRDRVIDNRVHINLIGEYHINHLMSGSLRIEIAGGVPFTPFDEERSKQVKAGILDKNRILGLRYPTYGSVTLRLDRRFEFKNSTLETYISLSNLFNRKNVDRYYWNIIENHSDVIYQGPILPMFGVSYRF